VYEYEAKYENQKLRAQKAEAEKNIAEQKADKQRLWFGIAAALLLSMAIFVVYWSERKRKRAAEAEAKAKTRLAEESKALAEAQTALAQQNEEIAAKEKEHGERLSELFAEIEYRNEKLDKAAFSQKQMMDEIATYFKNKEEEKALKYLKVIVNQTHTSKEEERKQQVATFREQHPQFLPNLLSKHEGFQGKYQHQDMAVLLAQGTTDMGEVAELFGCSKKRAQNIQSEVRALLQQPQENVGDYLRKLTSSMSV
jgi:hypothetical protein